MPDIENYYDDLADVVDYNFRMVAADDSHRSKGSKQLLQPGRIVVLNDVVSWINGPHTDSAEVQGSRQHFRLKLAVVCRTGQDPDSEEGVAGKIKTYEVIALVDPTTKTKEHKSGEHIRAFRLCNNLSRGSRLQHFLDAATMASTTGLPRSRGLNILLKDHPAH